MTEALQCIWFLGFHLVYSICFNQQLGSCRSVVVVVDSSEIRFLIDIDCFRVGGHFGTFVFLKWTAYGCDCSGNFGIA